MTIHNLKNQSNLRLVKVISTKEKKKWLDRFTSSYSGGVTVPSVEIFKDHICEFYVAVERGKECGYIRLLNLNIQSPSCQNPTFRIALEAYVKPPYRKNGILRFMLEEGVKRLQVQAIRIDADRYEKNYRYYQTLGFTFGYRDPMGYPSTVYLESAREFLIKSSNDKEASNDEDFRKVA